jgi:hypothetical protein
MEEGAGGYPREIELWFIQELEDWILGGAGVLVPAPNLANVANGNCHQFRERKERRKGI